MLTSSVGRVFASCFPAVVLAVTLVVTNLTAQQTYVVAPQMGPGVHFTSLPSAVLAVASGDTLLLRAGTYSGFGTSKGLTILGDPGAAIEPTPTLTTSVAGLPAGESFVLRNVALACSGFCGSGPLLNLQYNSGTIHLEGVTFSSPTQAGITISSCAHVTLTGCSGNARGCLSVTSSAVSLVECTFLGERGVYLLGSPPAVQANDATVLISGGTFRGGPGQGTGPSQVLAGPGIRCRVGTMTLAGNALSVEAGAAPAGQGPIPALVVEAGGSADLEPAVQLIPQNGASGATGPVTVRRIPSLVGGASVTGIQLGLHAPQGHIYGLVAGLPAGPLPTLFGAVWLQPTTAIGLTSGVVGAAQQVAFSFGLTQPVGGLPLVFHALTIDQQSVEVSPPCTVIVP